MSRVRLVSSSFFERLFDGDLKGLRDVVSSLQVQVSRSKCRYKNGACAPYFLFLGALLPRSAFLALPVRSSFAAAMDGCAARS